MANVSLSNSLSRGEGSSDIEPRLLSSYTVQLSSNLCRSLFPMEITFAEIESHGAVILTRFTSGERTEQFELSGAEFDALVVTVRRRRRLLTRARSVAFSELDLPF